MLQGWCLLKTLKNIFFFSFRFCPGYFLARMLLCIQPARTMLAPWHWVFVFVFFTSLHSDTKKTISISAAFTSLHYDVIKTISIWHHKKTNWCCDPRWHYENGIQEYNNTNMVYLTKKAYILCQHHGLGRV